MKGNIRREIITYIAIFKSQNKTIVKISNDHINFVAYRCNLKFEIIMSSRRQPKKKKSSSYNID